MPSGRPLPNTLSALLLLSTACLPAARQPERPLPDIPTLMHSVEVHQRADELRERDYIYTETVSLDRTDKHGAITRHETSTAQVFWLRGVPVRKTISKNGQPLSPDELKKEDRRIDKEVQDAAERRAKSDSKGEETDPRGNEVVTVSRLLELGAFTNPRRLTRNGRDTIAVDYTGDPHAHTRNRAEDVIHDLAGTVWIDEQDREIVRIEGEFVRPFKIAGGLLANVTAGTRFAFEQAKVNNDVWLPARGEGSGDARFLLLFNFRGRLHITETDYRRFQTSSTLLPGVSKPEPEQP